MSQKMNTIHAVQCLIACSSKQPALGRDRTHHGKMISSVKHFQDRCFSNWSIGSQDGWQQIKARFIHKQKQSALQNSSFLDLEPGPSTPTSNFGFIALSSSLNRLLRCPV